MISSLGHNPAPSSLWQAGVLRAQQLDRSVQEFAGRLQHTALTTAATVGRFASYFVSPQ